VATHRNMPRHIRTCTARPFALRVKELEQTLQENAADEREAAQTIGTKRKRGEV
jgi:hypothetical protein